MTALGHGNRQEARRLRTSPSDLIDTATPFVATRSRRGGGLRDRIFADGIISDGQEEAQIQSSGVLQAGDAFVSVTRRDHRQDVARLGAAR